MRGFISLLGRFHRDERGVFAVLFGVFAIVLIAAAGAVVDFTRIELARTKAQQALDSAALGLQPKMFLTTPYTVAQYKTDAKALVIERLADTTITTDVDVATTNTTDGTLHLEGSIVVPTAFVALIGIPSVKARIMSEATRKRLNLEIAMVLDNSNSMSTNSRMTNLIAAAKCASNILFNSDCNSTATVATNANTSIGIVPFTLAVNVGASNSSASWIDRTGSNSASPTLDNFDTDDDDSKRTITTLDRLSLYDKLSNVNWGGCVEARIHDTTNNRLYDTDDTVPSTSTPYSLFTPYFAPDEPDTGGYNNSYLSDRPSACTNKDNGTWVKITTKTTCTSAATTANGYNNASCSGNTSTSTSQTDGNGTTVTAQASEPSTINGNPKICVDTYSNTRTSTNPSRYSNSYTRTCSYNFTDRELQERVCKYFQGVTVTKVNQGSVQGPNGDCPTNAIQPLTATKSEVTTAINALAAQGGTNIHAGVEWGFRVLSPTLPFDQGRAYSVSTAKIMIIMTDGENTAYPTGNMNNATFYSYYGYPYNGRLGSTSSTEDDLQLEMNARTVATCNNAKAKGIEVYTVGLAVSATSDPTGNTKMLNDCSSGDGYAYFPANSTDLVSVFTQIANKLTNLRLSK